MPVLEIGWIKKASWRKTLIDDNSTDREPAPSVPELGSQQKSQQVPVVLCFAGEECEVRRESLVTILDCDGDEWETYVDSVSGDREHLICEMQGHRHPLGKLVARKGDDVGGFQVICGR